MFTRKIYGGEVFVLSTQLKYSKKCFKGIFYLDRDGVIIEDYGYVGQVHRVKLIDGAASFIKACKLKQILTAVVTNQSGIGRGYYSWNDYIEVTEEINRLLGVDSHPDIIIACSTSPKDNKIGNYYRKPETGMIEYIRREFLCVEQLNEYLAGDKESDILCGIKANIANIFHVLTGHGHEERAAIDRYLNKSHNIMQVNSIAQLVDWIS